MNKIKSIIFTILILIGLGLAIYGGVVIYNHYALNVTPEITPDPTPNPGEEGDELIGGGTTLETRIERARTVLDTVPFDSVTLPETFDDDIVRSFEEKTTYVRLFSMSFDFNSYNCNQYNVFAKFYLDEELTKPIYILERLIFKHSDFGYLPNNYETWEPFHTVVGMTGFLISYDGLTFKAPNASADTFYKTMQFYTKGANDKVYSFKFGDGKYFWGSYKYHPSSFFNLEPVFNTYSSFLQNGLKTVDYNINVASIINAYDVSNNSLQSTFKIKFSYYNLENYLIYKKNSFLSKNDKFDYRIFYRFDPVATPNADYTILTDGHSVRFNRKGYEEYSFKTNLMAEDARSAFENDLFLRLGLYFNSAELSYIRVYSKIESVYFKSSFITFDRDTFNNVNLDYFLTELTETGIRILSMPANSDIGSISLIGETWVAKSQRIKFKILEFDSAENLIDTAVSEINILNKWDYTLDNFQIIFDDNFSLNLNTKVIKIVLVDATDLTNLIDTNFYSYINIS